VTLRISGFFRDAFPQQVDLVASAARAVAALDEPPAQNPLAERVARDREALEASGMSPEAAARRAGHRVFGSKPGALWRRAAGTDRRARVADYRRSCAGLCRLGRLCLWRGSAGDAEHGLFERRLASVEGVIHNQDNREHDLLDSDDYYQFEGGLAAAVTELSGRRPVDLSQRPFAPRKPSHPPARGGDRRVVRGRVVNPKWIAGVMRHGYKGAFEMAATVDYMFAFAATTGAVADHHFDAVYEAYLADPAVRGFLLAANPDAAREMAERLMEAMDRGLWRPRANAAYDDLAGLRRAA
jgi:Cobalamin biosynthesis protein CobN and related Mg-chelatases